MNRPRYPTNQRATPSLSSWGAGGYSDVWLSRSNDWVYRPDLATQRQIADFLDLEVRE